MRATVWRENAQKRPEASRVRTTNTGSLAAAAVGHLADRVDARRQAVLRVALGERRERVEVDVDVALEHGAQAPGELGPRASSPGGTRGSGRVPA